MRVTPSCKSNRDDSHVSTFNTRLEMHALNVTFCLDLSSNSPKERKEMQHLTKWTTTTKIESKKIWTSVQRIMTKIMIFRWLMMENVFEKRNKKGSYQ